ncbi:response regulator [Shewanella sp. VB17]|uniref:response regulator n=1 Tax=Shewanella sp. VB17 TaxID=2739432 RepID=UPI001564D625|nr:response regulator [Shewanella sp. VB17]NRD74116.1 response regulator [Shewanella sp. VB17]
MSIYVWNNLSVKNKLFSLVLIPIVLLLTLAGRQVYFLTIQMSELERSNNLSLYLQTVSLLYRESQHVNVENAGQMTASLSAKLTTLSPAIFRTNTQTVNTLIDNFNEATLSIIEANDQYEKLDAIEWQADLYQLILLSIERVPLEHSNTDIKHHLYALLQLEWLMFWSNEEDKLSRSLFNIHQDMQKYDHELAEQIQTLSQRQLLFLERFVSLNANTAQVALMVNTFKNEVFITSQQFRSILLNMTAIESLTQQDVNRGLNALSTRLTLLLAVGNNIKSQFQSDVEQAIDAAEIQRALFISMITVLTLLVIGFALSFARQMTHNLNLILTFIKSNDIAHQSLLSALIKGKDELSLFAQQVARLTWERHQTNEKLIVAKEAAEQAKDEAIQASKAKSSFLANMSHEIRTPLNGVIGIAEILADTALSPTQQDYLDTIETSSQLLLSLINDILDFSKIESGMLLINPGSTCIRETIYDVAAIAAPKAREKGIEIKVNISENTPCRVMVDDHRLRQILMNFMSNAVKFTLQGSVTLSIETQNITDENTQIRFAVQDSGIGIDELQQQNIFTPFIQEDDSITKQFGGTGLGLAISTQLVEIMGGEILLDSRKGQGSCFYFDLQLPIDIQHYEPKNAFTPITLVCNNPLLRQYIGSELSFYQVAISQHIDTIEAILAQPIAQTKSLSTIIILEDVIYQNSPVLTQENNQTLKKQFETLTSRGVSICLIRPFLGTHYDFGNSIAAVLFLPLLGTRLLKALETCQASHQVIMSSQTTELMKNNNVLIVEDNLVNQKIAGLHVAKAGFDFDLANNGEEAIQMYTKHPHYAAILMDCMMPVMDGFTATEQIRNIEKERNMSRRIPIIALTASVLDDDIQKCFDVGMDDYLSKPFKMKALKEKLLAATESITLSNTIKNNEKQQLSVSQTNITKPCLIKSARILLVEDNHINQEVASYMLLKAGYSFDIADNGQDAVDMYRKDNSYDIILMDCMMPIKDGFTASEEIRAHEHASGLNKTPIIALTASIIDDDVQRCYDSGMDAYVAKPVRKEKLLHQIESVMI